MINGFAKFVRLSPEERTVLVRAFALLVLVRCSLWLISFATLQRTVASISRSPRKEPAFPISRGIWAICTAGRYVPRATCLTQALAAQVLLGRAGIPTSVKIGVAKENGKFDAHAWLESDGKVLLGGGEANSRYVSLLQMELQRDSR